MKALVLKSIADLKTNPKPLQIVDFPDPSPGPDEMILEVTTCGICRTELDEIEGRTPPAALPAILGHQVIGRVIKTGNKACQFRTGDRVGVGWIFSACGTCAFCRAGNENLCNEFKATGRDAPGGYAELMAVSENFSYPIPDIYSDSEAAPLLCAGAVGYRSLRLCNLKNGQYLGLTGFGASAHLIIQMAKKLYPQASVFVFARNEKEQAFAKDLGAVWTGDTMDPSPEKLHCIIDTTPSWKPFREALSNLRKGGRLVVNAIRKEESDKGSLLDISYSKHLWLEKEVKSVANVTRRDIQEFLKMAAEIPIRPEVREFPFEDANAALLELKSGKIRGAKVLRIHSNTSN
jgi:propanol-preferring alcohol dehydrogenase